MGRIPSHDDQETSFPMDCRGVVLVLEGKYKRARARSRLTRTPRKLPELIVNTWTEEEDSFWTPMSRLLAFNYQNLELLDYDPYPSIKAEVAV